MRNLLNINRAIKLMENDYNNLSTMYEMVDIQYNQMYEDNETKMFIEGISIKNPFKGKIEAWKNRKNKPIQDQEVNPSADNPENDKIADEEITKKKSIIKRIIDWFKKVFKSIKDKVKSIFKKRADKKQKVEVSKELMNDIKEIKEYYNRTKSPMNQMATGDIDKASDIIENIPVPLSIENSGNNSSDSSTNYSSTTSDTRFGNPETNTQSNMVVNITIADRDKLVDDMNKISMDLEKNIDKTEDNANKTVEQKKRTGLKALGIKILNKVSGVLSIFKKVVLKVAKIIAILSVLAGIVVGAASVYADANPNSSVGKRINVELNRAFGKPIPNSDDGNDDWDVPDNDDLDMDY